MLVGFPANNVDQAAGPRRRSLHRLVHTAGSFRRSPLSPSNREVRGSSVSFAASVSTISFRSTQRSSNFPREACKWILSSDCCWELVWEALGSQAFAFIPGGRRGWGLRRRILVDYLYRFISDPLSVDTQMMTGNCSAINRKSDIVSIRLRGPSLTVDTACSSSLVALTQACETITSGRLKRAIVAGVSLLSAPYPFIGSLPRT